MADVEPELRIEPLDAPRAYRVLGEAAFPASAELRELLAGVCRSPGDVTLDMAGVSYMDSQGLRAIIAGCQMLGETGSMLLVNPTEQILRLLDLTGIQRTIPNLRVIER